MLAIACGSDAVPATSVPPTFAPFVAPTAIKGSSEISTTGIALLNLGPKKDVPIELGADSPRLPADEVQRIWTEWLTNIAIVIGNASLSEYCDGGNGNYVFDTQFSNLDGESFTWTVNKSPATAWNVATVRWGGNAFLDGAGFDLRPPTGVKFSGQGEAVVFDNPTCGQ